VLVRYGNQDDLPVVCGPVFLTVLDNHLSSLVLVDEVKEVPVLPDRIRRRDDPATNRDIHALDCMVYYHALRLALSHGLGQSPAPDFDQTSDSDAQRV